MFQPPPSDPNEHVSEKPMPALPPVGASGADDEPAELAASAPQGDELFYYVFDCLNRGSSQAEVRKQLIAFGYSAAEADETVAAVADWRRKNPEQRDISRAAGGGGGNTNMWIGGIVCLIGLVITIGSCLAAGEGGGRYMIAWGAIIWGGIQFFRGLSQRNQ